jgi:hypothetical protein
LIGEVAHQADRLLAEVTSDVCAEYQWRIDIFSVA